MPKQWPIRLVAQNMMLDDVAYVRATRRLEQAYDALTWLTHLAKYSQTYPWYDMMRASVVAENAAVVPGLEGNALELAASWRPVRTTIADRCGESDDTAHRTAAAAANALTEAVLRRGLMLKKTEIYRQYDRYNASKAAIPRRKTSWDRCWMLSKPTKPTIHKILDRHRTDEILQFMSHVTPKETGPPIPGLIGESEAMENVYSLIRKVARSNASILLLGETGTGKELVPPPFTDFPCATVVRS